MSKLQDAIFVTIVVGFIILGALCIAFNWIVIGRILAGICGAIAVLAIIEILIIAWKAARKEIAQKRKEREESEDDQ